MAFSALGAGGGALSGAAAGSMFGPIGTIGGAILGGLGGSNLFGMGSKTGQGLPTYNPNQALKLSQKQYNQMSGNALGFGSNLFQSAANNALAYAPAFTQSNIDLQNKVTPGSSAQREAALQQINSYIQGQVPQDVQQNTQRAIAQSFGGGYNPFTGGGQAPSAFARNIGQTSVGLSQFGLSAAPTWQELANRMVTKPESLMGFGIQSGQIGAGLASSAASLGNDLSQSQYQSQFNQYQANQLADQQNQQLAMQLGQMGLDAFKAKQKGDYYGNLSPSAQGKQNTLGLPSLLASLGSIFGGGAK
jgi:hypothetical protein